MSEAQTGTKLSVMQQVYIEWCATGCVWPKNYDEPRKIDTVSEFCRFTKMSRRTVYNWERDIDDFWDRVERIRSKELSRRVGEYYKWAEMSARPITEAYLTKEGEARVRIVRSGSAEHLKILLGQSGRKRPEKSEVKNELSGEVGLSVTTVDYKNA